MASASPIPTPASPLETPPTATPRSLVIFANVLAIVAALLAIELLLIALDGALTYDEANYLHISAQIRASGLPIWYWHPDLPAIFSASPPLMLYAIAAIQDVVGGVPGTRLLYFIFFGIPAVALTYWATRRAAGPVGGATSVAFLLLSGFWLTELVRVRFDLPLALVSFALLLLFAEGVTRQVPRWQLGAFVALSAIGLATKYQFATVTGTLLVVGGGIVLFSRDSQQRRRAAVYLGLHLLAIAIAAIGLWWFYREAASAIASADGGLTGAIETQIGNRLLPSGNLGREAALFLKRLEGTAANISVPAVLCFCTLLLTADRRRTSSPSAAPAASPLTGATLTVLCLGVVAFNLLTYRIDASTQYVTQLAPPLAYLFGLACSRIAVAPAARSWRLGLLASAFALHGILNIPDVGLFFRPNVDRAIATYLQPRLTASHIVLMGNAHQSRDIPFWLDRTQNYGFLWSGSPDSALELISRGGDRAVGALVLPRQLEAFFWRDPNWQSVRAAVEANFAPAPNEVGGGFYSVYLRQGL